jgi:tetratricopeptide (TPR) repeat protein
VGAGDVPSSAGPHSVALRDLARLLSLSDGFVLVPVEVRGPDEARALAAWLDGQGWKTVLVEPVDDEGWQSLVADVMDAPGAGARVVIVVGDREPSHAQLAALRLVNQRRDSIAQALARPLLWCGPPEFLKLTWERAPDFWSIRAMTRKLETGSPAAREAPLWPGEWVADPPERLRAMLAAARRQGDAPNAGRAAALLAQALVARGELEEAAEVAAESRDTPQVKLVEGVLAALRGERARAEGILADGSWAAGVPELEGRRLVALGNLDLDEDRPRAVARYEAARTLLHDAQDGANEAVALANLGIASMAEGALDEAARRMQEALALAREVGDANIEAGVLTKLGRVYLLERDSRRACATLEEALVRLRQAGDARREHEALRRLARAYLELGDPEKAETDARRAATLARSLGDESAAVEADAIAEEARAELTAP